MISKHKKFMYAVHYLTMYLHQSELKDDPYVGGNVFYDLESAKKWIVKTAMSYFRFYLKYGISNNFWNKEIISQIPKYVNSKGFDSCEMRYSIESKYPTNGVPYYRNKEEGYMKFKIQKIGK